jgi:hypothetical protein
MLRPPSSKQRQCRSDPVDQAVRKCRRHHPSSIRLLRSHASASTPRSGRYQLMWSHSHIMWVLAPGYYQLIWSENADVIGSCDLCYRAATTTPTAWITKVSAMSDRPQVQLTFSNRHGLQKRRKPGYPTKVPLARVDDNPAPAHSSDDAGIRVPQALPGRWGGEVRTGCQQAGRQGKRRSVDQRLRMCPHNRGAR